MIVKVLGLKQLGKKLAKLEDSTITEMAMDKACQIVENDAKVRCPVDDGQLRQSITHEVTDGGLTGVVGTNVEYAPYVHQGTGIYARNGDGRKTRWSYQDAKGQWHSTIGQRPQPFLEEALDANEDKILSIFKQTIEEEMD